MNLVDHILNLVWLTPVITMAGTPFGIVYFGWSTIRQRRSERQASYFLAISAFVFGTTVINSFLNPVTGSELFLWQDIMMDLFGSSLLLGGIIFVWTLKPSRREQ